MYRTPQYSIFFFFNDTATTEIYTLSLHDALPIYHLMFGPGEYVPDPTEGIVDANDLPMPLVLPHDRKDRKSTRLNSSHGYISYAVFCLKKKKKNTHLVHTIHTNTVHVTSIDPHTS